MRGRLFLAVALLALATAASAFAAGHTPQHSRFEALHIFESDPKVSAWLSRYPVKGRSAEETYERVGQQWTIKIFWDTAGEIAEGTVFDLTGEVTEAWTGPQVAWGMARGSPGAFGGSAINSPWVWGAFCLVFLLGLGDWKRPFSLRTLDLLVLLSPTASLWYFNHGNVFAS